MNALGFQIIARNSPAAREMISSQVPMKADESLRRVEDAVRDLIKREVFHSVENELEENVIKEPHSELVDPERTVLSVAIIVPTYGDGQFLEDCLRSVKQQTYMNWVCYVVDDASPDSIDHIFNRFAASDDRFVMLRHFRNRGLAAARNSALSVAQEDLVQFLDADDLLTPWSLENRILALTEGGDSYAGAHGQILQCTEETLLEDVGRWRQFHRLPDRDFMNSNGESPFTVHAPLTRMSVVREVGGFNEQFYNGAEDWEFWSRLLRTGARFAGANRVAGAYRQRAQSMIRQGLDVHLQRAEELMKRADLPARWCSGESAPISIGLSDLYSQERILRRTAVWTGISVASAVLSGEPIPLDVEVVDDPRQDEQIVKFLKPTLAEAARRGVIRGFGLSVNCINRLSEDAQDVIKELSEQIASQLSASMSTSELTMDETGDFLEIDLSLPVEATFIALSKPRDFDLPDLAHLDRSECVFIDLSSEGGHHFPETYGYRIISLAEFILQWRSQTPARVISSYPIPPALRSPELKGLVDVTGVDLYPVDLNPDVEPEQIQRPYRVLMNREENCESGRSDDELKLLKDAHRDETCVIIGNGPSLNQIDMNLVAKFPHFAVNSFFLLEEKIVRPPDFYVVEDTAVFKDNFQEIIDFDARRKFFPTIYKDRLLAERSLEELGNPLFFRMNQGFYGRSTGALGYPRFSQDFSQRAYCGQSVTMINLQLAYWMGFSQVLLVGMDFSYQIPSDAKVDGNIIVSQSDDPNHFDPRYFGSGKTWKDPKLSRVLQNYRLAKEVFEADGRRILNCSVGGALEIFDRSSLEERV